MLQFSTKSVSHSLSPKEKPLLQFSGSTILLNKVLILPFTLDLFVFIFFPSRLRIAQKMKFSMKDFLANVTKSAISCGFGHIY